MHQLLVATVVLVAFCSLGRVDSSAYDKIVSHSRIRARKEGPNTCALQQVSGTKKKYFSTCRNWYKGTICGKKATVLYECCPGYMKLEGMKGCPAVAPIDTVYGTLGLVKAITTQQYTDISKLREEIEGKGSFTMFAPSNEAWNQLDPTARSALVSNVNIELYNALHFHMVNRRLLTKDMKNDMSVKSMYNDLGLYINHYSNGIVTVNCARIIHGNQVATNGVVHVVDRIISAVGNTIHDVLGNDDDLSSFNNAVLTSGMMEKLNQPGHYTLFAPTNDAFDKLSPGYLERIMEDKDVIAALVNYHLLNTVQCSEAIMSGSVYETAEGSNIEIGCDGDSLTVNGIKMVLRKDIVTTNGVIHVIDKVLIPDAAKDGIELIGDSQKVFIDMVSELGLAAAMRPKTEYTLLAPLDNAFTNEVRTAEQSLLRYILENHILKLKITLSELYNGQTLETLAGKLLRVFIYRTAVCIENACMVRGSREGSHSALHVMSSIIKPPEKTMFELLKIDGRFKIFLSLMEIAGLTDMLRVEGSYTMFAPTDDAFDGLTKEDFQLLKSDLNALRVILLYHFSNGIFINGGLEGGVTNLLKSLQGNNLQVKFVNNTVNVNSVDVPESDWMATNGVIHVVKNLLYPADLPVGRQDLLVLLKKLIKYIQIRYISGFTYTEIPITFIKKIITTTHYFESVPNVTTITKFIQGEPIRTHITKLVEGEPTYTKITRVIETEPTVTKVFIEGEPVVTTLTKVIEGEPVVTTLTKVIEGEPVVTRFTKVIEGEPVVTTLTKVIEGEPVVTRFTKVIEGEPVVTRFTKVIEGEPVVTTLTKVIEGEPVVTRFTKVIEGEPVVTRFTKVIEGEPVVTRFTKVIEGEPVVTRFTKVIEGEPSITKITRRVEEDPSFTKVTRVIESGSLDGDGKTIKGGPRYITASIPFIIQGPDFSKITTIHGNPNMIDQESDRITKLIREGGRYAAARKTPAGMRRRGRLVRRHHKPRE